MAHQQNPSAEPHVAAQRPILIVDDDSERRDAIARAIVASSDHLHFVMAGDGDQALQYFLEFRPLATILDMVLPGRTGFDVLDELARLHPDGDHPVIALSKFYGRRQITKCYPVTDVIKTEQVDVPAAVVKALDGVIPVFSGTIRCKTPAIPATRGSLVKTAFASLYVHALSSGLTGYIGASHKNAKRVVFFDRGRPVYVRASLTSESFSGFLYQRKIITREQARGVRNHCKSGSGNFDYVAIKEQGLVPSDELRELHREYVRRRVIRCFGAEGQYVYASDAELASKVPQRALAAIELFFDAVDERLTTNVLEQRLGVNNRTRIQAPTTQPLVDLNCDADLTRVSHYFLQQAGLTLQEAADKVGLSYHAILKFFYILYEFCAIGYERGTGSTNEPKITADASVSTSAKEREKIESFIELYFKTRKNNYFEVFGIEAGDAIDQRQVRTEYHRLSKLCHPDRFRSYKHWKLESAIDYLSQRVNRAYETLTDDTKRRAYLDKLSGKQSVSSERTELHQKVRNKASEYFNNGLSLLSERDVAGASQRFRQALELSPDDANYGIHYYFTRFFLDAESRSDVIARLKAMVAKTDPPPKALFYLGVIDLHRGSLNSARKLFTRSLKADNAQPEVILATEILDEAIANTDSESKLRLSESILDWYRPLRGASSSDEAAPDSAESGSQDES